MRAGIAATNIGCEKTLRTRSTPRSKSVAMSPLSSKGGRPTAQRRAARIRAERPVQRR